MPDEPMSFFGWLMNCCVSEGRAVRSREAIAEALVFASGTAASLFTIYVAGFYHLI